MLLSPLIPFLVAAGPPVTINPGYYSLRSLAQVFERQGVAVKVDPKCARIVYGLSFQGVPAAEVLNAIASEGSVTAEETNAVWTIHLDPATESAESALRRKYLQILGERLRRPFVYANTQVAKGATLNPQERTSLAHSLELETSKLLPPDKYGNHLAILYLRDNEIAYANIAVPLTILGSVANGSVSPTLSGKVIDYQNLLTSNGKFDELPFLSAIGIPTGADADSATRREQMMRLIPVSLHANLDPLTGNGTYGLSFHLTQNKQPTPMTLLGGVVASGPYSPNVFFQDLLTPTTIKANDALAARTGQALGSDAFKGTMPSASTRLAFTDGVLQYCEKQKLNVVVRPSAFYDGHANVTPATSFADFFKECTSRESMLKESEGCLEERIGFPEGAQAPVPATLLARRFLDLKAKTLVVRNEGRFLDGFCSGSPIVSESIANQGFAKRFPSLGELCEAVDQDAPGEWPNHLFSNRYLDYCNPLALYPLARFFAKSSGRDGWWKTLEQEKAVSVHYGQLANGERNELASAFAAIAKNYVMREGSAHPLRVVADLKNKDPQSIYIHVQKVSSPTGNRYTFKVDVSGQTVWRARASNVGF